MLNPTVAEQKFLALSPSQRAALQAIVNQKRVTSYPYFSKVRFHADQSGAGPFTYVIAQGTEVRAFSYAFDTGNAVTAGFPAAMVATQAETNLTQAGETISGENVQIKGIACQLVHGLIDDDVDNQLFTDSRLVAQLNECVSAELSLNGGQNAFQLGILPMIPGAGGMIGAGIDTLGQQPIDGGRPIFHFAQNGWPVASNAAWLPEGLVWRASGRQDGLLNIRLTVRREITLFSGGLIDITVDDEAAAAGIRGYTYPAEVGAEYMFFLKGVVIGPRTRSA
jgi:hypothetical protein